MITSRKDFLKTGLFLAGGVLFNSKGGFAKWPEQSGNFIKIRGDVGIYTERGGTIGCFCNKDAFIVIDTQFPDTCKNFLDGMRKTTERKIDVVLNTHHHPDHTSGNIYIKDYTSMIVAHERCKEYQILNGKNDPSKPQAYPNVTFDNEWTLDLGAEKVLAKHLGPAHTGGDSIVHFQKTNIVHLGDLVFNKLYPYIDLDNGGSITNWIKVLATIENTFDKDTLYIFGHSQKPEMCYGNVYDIIGMRNYLSALLDFVNKEIHSGEKLEQVLQTKEIPGVKDIKEMRDGMIKMNLEKAYQELTK